jgi:hypothetical protein
LRCQPFALASRWEGIAPLTANTRALFAGGFADYLLNLTVLASGCPMSDRTGDEYQYVAVTVECDRSLHIFYVVSIQRKIEERFPTE